VVVVVVVVVVEVVGDIGSPRVYLGGNW